MSLNPALDLSSKPKHRSPVICRKPLAWPGSVGNRCHADCGLHQVRSVDAPGLFFGNAIVDWSGVLVTVIMTRHLYEKGSRKADARELQSPKLEFLHEHSLTVFLVTTWFVWIAIFRCMDPNSRWGQVVSNIGSEWTQTLGLVWLTKILMEVGSKEAGAVKLAQKPQAGMGRSRAI